ncbi:MULTISPECIES: acylphosphatase [Cetobacterium]|jgi:acylphosphatase|uniref:acylphosphatase n=1 Tax=Candidatus Cetobacterium colombiensis TaxID=3073100 RepID=A0ABU4WAV4_9FUSO|nr:acylphosphatase [Candidatus Cetobacterium colombiensis]MDX8335706.1 acylphosphatase [Candidatus Cetobacterium colombiensis]
MKTYHFIIKGHVQGVGYRITTYLNATRLGVNGTVKNLPDDSVEVFAQGEEKIIDNFKKYLKIGPSMSRVDEIQETIEDKSKFESFQVIY